MSTHAIGFRETAGIVRPPGEAVTLDFDYEIVLETGTLVLDSSPAIGLPGSSLISSSDSGTLRFNEDSARLSLDAGQ